MAARLGWFFFICILVTRIRMRDRLVDDPFTAMLKAHGLYELFLIGLSMLIVLGLVWLLYEQRKLRALHRRTASQTKNRC